MKESYLDNAATTPLSPQVREAISAALTLYANPASLHRPGVEAEKQVDAARENVARLLGVSPASLVFTSGGTEANNLAIKGFLARSRQRGRLVTSRVEHPSVLEVFKELESRGYEVLYLPVDDRCQVQLSALEEALAEPVKLVSIMAVNNETGAIQPIKEIVNLVRAKQPEVCIHVDAVQALGKIPVRPRELGVNLVSISAHKIHGAKGTGALYADRRDLLLPLIHGGGQEAGLRSGTENTLGIIGFGCAAREAEANMAANQGHVTGLRHQFLQGLQNLPCKVISPADGVPYIVAVSFPGFRGEVLLHALSAYGVYVSTGAACSGKKGQMSHVAEAMGLDRETAEGLLRFSFSALTTEREVEYAVQKIRQVLADLSFVRGRRSR
ncbi:MAG: cysteine desulfurase [Firmicutes bacterium]|nr:cysteine desulfurase [Bacillota bacterium]